MQCWRSLPLVTLARQPILPVSSFPIKAQRAASTFAEHIIRVPVQSYLSESRDAFFNLSFEHYLLQHTPIDSAVLFLYINRPCVVIGRNQNPWAEVNLSALKDGISGRQHVDLVRRRSGGGTVFHDTGNVNWTVISPAKTFTRDKHVEMVVRALRACGVQRARVNERHDIVLDAVEPSDPMLASSESLHRTTFNSVRGADGQDQTVKVSGSAYKLTRGRALHHGTCLLQSPFLGKNGALSKLLHAPAREHITAKGVESVRSPVGNIGITPDQFVQAVRAAFANMYAISTPIEVSEASVSDIEAVSRGMAEMRTPAWTFGQTPQFTVSIDSSHKFINDTPILLPGTSVHLNAKHGKFLDGSIELPSGKEVFCLMKGMNLAENWDWNEVLIRQGKMQSADGDAAAMARVVDVLERILPTAKTLNYV